MTTPIRLDLPDTTLSGTCRPGAGGTPLVLVHGFGGSRHDWDLVTRALPSELPVIAYDMRGFGASPALPGARFSHADDLLALLDALELPEVDLCGVSLGGATVLGCALAEPGRVRRLVTVSPMLAGWSWSSLWVERWKQIGRAARAGDMPLARALWFDHPLFATTRLGPQSDRLKQAIAAVAGEQWVRDDQREEQAMGSRLSEITAPTLLLTGEHDLADFRLMADVIERAMPNVTRVEYADAGHLLTLERPEALAGAITAFLK